MDRAGSVYLSDSSAESGDVDCYCIRKISPEGTITTLAAGSGLFQPRALAVDSAGNLYIADNSRIRKVSPGGTITVAVGNGEDVHYLSDGGPATGTQLYWPVGVAAGLAGNKISKTGIITTALDAGTVLSAGEVWSLAVDKDDNLYVPDPGKNRISKISPEGVVTIIAGNGTHGYSGDGGPAINAGIRLLSKTALTTDSEGNLYFSDDDVELQPPPPGMVDSGSTPSTPRIRKVSHDGTITTVAGNGTSGFSGDGGPATGAQLGSQLNFPVALAADGTGKLYIADGSNSRIRVVSKDGIITTVAGTGASGYTGDGGPAAGAQFSGPSGLAIDGSGNLYVADQFNSVVRLLQPVSSNVSTTAVANAASGLPGPISPGELVVISGSGLGPAQLVSGSAGFDYVYAAQLAGTTVQFNGVPAPLIYTWATQVAAVVPYSILSGTAQITVAYQGRISAWFGAPVAPSAPGVFALDSTGKGQAVAFNQHSSINSPTIPANVGDVISLFVTGEGETTPAGIDGTLSSSPAPRPIQPVSVTIGGRTLTPEYIGGAAGRIAGLMQIDVRIPSGIQTGPSVPVTVQVGNSSSQEGVSIAVQ